MINQTLLWLLALPVICAIVVYALRREERDAWIPSLIFGVVAMVAVLSCFYISKGSQTGDVELWNGQVTSKQRVHGEYTRTYECNCTETCSGVLPPSETKPSIMLPLSGPESCRRALRWSRGATLSASPISRTALSCRRGPASFSTRASAICSASSA